MKGNTNRTLIIAILITLATLIGGIPEYFIAPSLAQEAIINKTLGKENSIVLSSDGSAPAIIKNENKGITENKASTLSYQNNTYLKEKINSNLTIGSLSLNIERNLENKIRIDKVIEVLYKVNIKSIEKILNIGEGKTGFFGKNRRLEYTPLIDIGLLLEESSDFDLGKDGISVRITLLGIETKSFLYAIIMKSLNNNLKIESLGTIYPLVNLPKISIDIVKKLLTESSSCSTESYNSNSESSFEKEYRGLLDLKLIETIPVISNNEGKRLVRLTLLGREYKKYLYRILSETLDFMRDRRKIN